MENTTNDSFCLICSNTAGLACGIVMCIRMINKIRDWKEKHPDWYELILYYLLS